MDTMGKRAVLMGAAVTAISAFGAAAQASSITAPYSDNYTTYTTGSAPANANIIAQPGYSPTWSLTTATNSPSFNNGNESVAMYYLSSDDGTDLAYQATNIPTAAGGGFSESTSFSLSGPTNDFYVGLGALGNSATLVVATSNSYVFADFDPYTHTSRIYVNENGTQTNSQVTYSTITLNTSDVYTENFTGSYTTGGQLALTFSLIDSTSQTTLLTSTYSVSASGAPNGQYFGLRDNGGGGQSNSTSESVYYDSYSLSALPEPASLSLVAMAGAGVLSRRGNRRRR